MCAVLIVGGFSWLSLQIATQISVLIAKVARLDCPRQWPELIPTLVESVKIQDDLRQHRALLTFYHVTKTLASKRLAADRKLFYDVSIFSSRAQGAFIVKLVNQVHLVWCKYFLQSNTMDVCSEVSSTEVMCR